MESLVREITLVLFFDMYFEDKARNEVRELAAYQALFPAIADLLTEELPGLEATGDSQRDRKTTHDGRPVRDS